MRSEIFDRRFLGAFLYDMPHDPLCHAVSPGLACPANAPKHAALLHASGFAPGVNGRLDPVGKRHRADVSAFADQVDDGPVILPALNTGKLKVCSLSAA